MKFLPLLPLLFIFAVGELLTRGGWISDYLFPMPSSVIEALFVNAGDLWKAAGVTLLSSLLGFLSSCVLGICFGILFFSSRGVERAFFPYAIFFQTVPIIAIAPLLVIWFGFGMPTVIASSFIVSVFPIIASTLTGFKSTDPALLDLFTLHKASRWDRLWKLRFPSALPHIFVGFRIAAGLSVIGAIVGEFIAGGGLGGFIDIGRTRQRVDFIFAAIILASMIGLGLVMATNMLTRRYTFSRLPG